MPRTRSGSEGRASTSRLARTEPAKKTKKTRRRPGPRKSSSTGNPKLSQFVRDLQALPTTKIGIEMQAKFITKRISKIKSEQDITDTDFSESTLTDLFQKIHDIPGFGPYGKVGLHIRKETLEMLEEELARITESDDDDQADDDQGSLSEEDGGSATLDDDDLLTAEDIQETFEGLDKDLLGVNSQSALDKISAFVTKTIADNHPSKDRPQAANIQSSATGSVPAVVPTIPSSISSPSAGTSGTKQPPFKFAFLSVVATYDAKCAISLQDLQAKVRTVTFDPTWFHSAVLTFPKSECRAAIFENGKFVLTGVTTIKMALIAARNVLEIFKLCGYNPDISKRNFRAKNLTALMELGVNIDIAGFAEKHQHNTYMDQDTFGAVTHFPEKSPSTIHKGGLGLCLLIFATGKIVLVGGKTEKHMISVFRDKTLNLLKPFAFGWS